MISQFLPAAQRLPDRCLALAGMLRAALEVQEAARRGRSDNHLLLLSVQSILAIDAQDSIAALAGLEGLQRALQALCPLLHRGPAQAEEAELLRYTLSLAKLSGRLLAQPKALDRVQRGIEQARRQVDHFGELLHPSVLAGLADTYAEGIGTLSPRIIVSGESRFLTRDEDTARIRTLLLGGIRAGVLWRQAGGRIWSTLLERGKLCECSRDYLRQLPGRS
ncbi:high frequency lysogenization protein HflD [Acidithiobacillus sp. YTS05]|uniref:high frequency lysogenization protein HflD n=1 Tax=Igneacidithiobacillus copahuensis TaxID=2724909 RepID=UPI001C067819|nr:high frequency lysogenization protein HflD [Igneacidithiobacillus copahuensis]UTV82282.1 high frequency lysogenization protein HflD [Acidithiobacillus sp. YTS05]